MWSKPSVISWMVGVAVAMAQASLPAQEAATPAGGQVPIPATGEYASIDVRLLNESVRILETGDASARKAKAAEIRASPEQFAPPVFYSLSNMLFEEGQEDEAMFWFYAGQLRAGFDAMRCTDVSARQAVDVLNQRYGPPINKYAFQDLDKLESVVQKAVEWDRETPHEYDQRWINLHGMGAVRAGMQRNRGKERRAAPRPLSVDEGRWARLAEQRRVEYLKGFHEALAELKNKKD
ncbi:MAG: hypothetical protein ACRD2X_14315 [Vicinamibacteraceae bacterium]